MALVDLSSDLSKFRSEVSREPKNTPESSKATNNKNFATFQPITEKLSQFSMNIPRQEPKKLESKLDSTRLDDIVKMLSSELTVNRVSRLSAINDEYDGQTRTFVPDNMVSDRLGKIQIDQFSSRLTTSNVVPIKQSPGSNNTTSQTDVRYQEQGIFNTTSPTNIASDSNEQINNIVNPDIDVIVPPQTFDRTASSPFVLVNQEESTNNITDPKIDILRKPLSFDRENQSVEISKDLDSSINNITDPKTVLDINVLTYDRVKQSPSIITDIKQDGFVTDPKTQVFRFDGATVQTEDNSRLNVDGLPLRFIPISRLEQFELPREVDIARYDLESVQTDDNSSLNLDAVIKTNPSGRHENPNDSRLSIIGTQQVNFFQDNNGKGFIVRAQKGETSYTGQSQFGWSGKRESAPTTNFITDINGKGFTKFSQIGITDYETESSVFGFTTVQSTDFFDRTKTFTSTGFKTFSTLYESDYKPDSSQFDWDGGRENAPESNYFDITGNNTTVGFHKFAQIYDTKYIPDSSQFDWDGDRNSAPEVNYFDISGANSSTGFHRFAQIYDTKYIAESSIFDWDGNREQAPEVNYFDITGNNTTGGFHKFAQIYDTKYIAESSIFDWDGSREDAPEINYFDITGKNTTVGFHRFAQLYDTKYIVESSTFDWDGNREQAPEANYFDLINAHTTTGFHKFAQIYDTKYVHESSIYDWDGVRDNSPEVNYFDLNSQYTTTGFHRLAQIYDTKYIAESSRFDWDGVRTNAPEVNYFDLNSQHTTSGFHRLAQLYDTKYIPESSRFDWDGVRTNSPEVNFFDLNKQHQTVGFHRLAQIYDSKFIKDASLFDFDGGRNDAPEVNYFDLNSQFTTKGFEKFAQTYITKYIKDSSRFDFDGTSRSAPETDFFDITKKNTSKGFEKFPQLLVSRYVKDSSRFDFDGTSRSAPTTDFFPNTNSKGFTSFVQKLQTEYVKDSSEFTFKGSLPKEVNFFPDDNQSGFINKTPLLETKYEKDTSRFTFKGTLPTPVDFFPNTSATGFDVKTTPLETKYIQDVSRFTFKGSRAEAPSVNYFADDFNTGFTTLTQPLTTQYQADVSRFTFKGTRQDAPSVDYLQNNPAPGFQILVPPLETAYNKEVSRFTWTGTRQDSPEVDFLKIPGSNPNAVSGFTKLFSDVTATKLSDSFSRFSIESVTNFSSVKKVPYTKFFGFNPMERSGFLVGMTNTNSSLYPLLDPRLTPDDPSDIRLGIEEGRGGNRRQRTTDNVGKYAPKTLGGLFWSDGTNTGTATLGNQVPWMKVKSEGDGSTYFRKYERDAKSAGAGLGYLTRWATTRRSPSPLDNQYNKYKLQDESVNREIALFNQPFVVRGIQREGEVENQRWGFGVTFDDGIVRGGVITQVERIAMDVVRLGKWTLSVKGALFNIRQFGLQFMNPSVDVDPKKGESSLFGIPATNIFNPVSLLANVATARVGVHFARHGVLPFNSDYLNKYEEATKNRELNLSLVNPSYTSFKGLTTPSEAERDPSGYNRLIGLMKELLPYSFQPMKKSPQESSTANSLANTAIGAVKKAAVGAVAPDVVLQTAGGALGENAGVAVGQIGSATNTVQDTSNKAAANASSTNSGVVVINRLSSTFGGPNSFFGIGGTTIRKAGHPYLGSYTTSPELYNKDRAPQYLDSAKRESFYGAVDETTYTGELKSQQIASGGDFYGILKALAYTIGNVRESGAPKEPSDLYDKIQVQSETKNKIKNLDPFNPKYDFPLDRLERKTDLNSQRVGSLLSNGPSDQIADYNSNPIKKYRTSNYNQLKRNSRGNSKLNDFRFGFTTDSDTKGFSTDPDNAYFEFSNLEYRYGLGEHGEAGADRSKPFVNNISYAKFDKTSPNAAGTFKAGESKYNDYAIPKEKTGRKFRGDRINIIDYKRSHIKLNTSAVYELGQEYTDGMPGNEDLVEFYFSSLVLNGHVNCPAEVIVFRATFGNITDNHNPSWNAIKYMGRADPLYVYQGYERDISFDFTVHIGSRDEMKASWRKLNYLASWTAPEYLRSGYMRGPMVRLNIGHLYRKMPGYISSLSYTFDNTQTQWETAKLPEDMDFVSNPEIANLSKPGVLQLPKHIQVNVGFVPVGVYRPEFRGVMYSLYDDSQGGNDNTESGLMPENAARVNYFNEFDSLTELKSYSGFDEDGKSYTQNPQQEFESVSGTRQRPKKLTAKERREAALQAQGGDLNRQADEERRAQDREMRGSEGDFTG